MMRSTILTLPFLCLARGNDWWWYQLGGDHHPASEYLAATSPFYNWFKASQNQFDAYAPAQHVGKINRGTFLNPELNFPGDRSFGKDSDFNTGDFNSGAFMIGIPQAQKFVAKKIHVDAGLASKVGQVATMPLGVFVQDDGTLLMETGSTAADPCNPNPCSSSSATPRCVVVSTSTVKCIGPERIRLELKWKDPQEETGTAQNPLPNIPSNLDLLISPLKNYVGTFCSKPLLSPGDSPYCGVVMGDDKEATTPTLVATEVAEFQTLSDGTSFKDYTYQVFVEKANQKANPNYNLNNVGLRLNFYDDLNGSIRPAYVYTVPQGPQINTSDKDYFFFGCLRPSMNGIDTRGAGFYSLNDFVRGTTKTLFDGDVCEALRTVEPAITPGFQ